MLRLMLNDHPEVCWLNEFEYAVDLIPDEEAGQGLKGTVSGCLPTGYLPPLGL